MNIVHIITSLSDGGAQAMLYRLIKNIDKSQYNSIKVISMMDKGIYGEEIEKLGIKVYSLNMKRGIPTIKAFNKTVRIIKDADIVQTWMYHADLLGIMASMKYKNKKVIWGIHHSNLDKDKNTKLLLLIVKINSILSRFTFKIVSCSNYAKYIHTNYGYSSDKITVIPNGFDLSEFYYKEYSNKIVRSELNIDNDKKIVCHIGRWHILKDYETLMKSIKLICNKRDDVVFILCGADIDEKNLELMRLIELYKLEKNIYLLGRRNDISNIMSSSNALVLSSSGEAFPNVIGEAMACETPCIVTDVGDCKEIVGDTGIVVETKDSEGIASGIEMIINMDKKEYNKLRKKCRSRILNMFELKKIVSMYEALYKI